MKIFTKIMTFVVALCLSQIAIAQPPASCDGSRYSDDVFTASTVTTVKYGENTSIGGNLKELQMDIYQPVGDVAAMRPAIVVGFGGSFVAGNRGDVQGVCERYARKGYVAVAIDYRLYDGPFFPLPDSVAMAEEVIMAIADMKASIRFLRKDAATDNNYRIDPETIFASGISAGAIVADHVGFLSDISEVPPFLLPIMNDNGGFEGDTDDPANSSIGYSSKVQGIVNFFGASYQAAFVSSDDPPITSIHGDADGTVPYGHGFAKVFTFPIISMDGSSTIHRFAENAGIWNHFISVPDGGHGDFLSDPVWADSIYSTSSLMMDTIYCQLINGVKEQLDVSRYIVAAPNPASGNMRIGFNGLHETFDLLVYDNLGRLIKAFQNVNDDIITLEQSDFSAGFYHANIRFHNSELAPVTKKLIFSK